MREGWSFSDVDAAGDADEVARRLDLAAEDLADTKTRLTALLGSAADGRWLDLGCGVGHDLAGHRHAVGLDASCSLLVEARHRLPAARLVAGDGHALPFAAASLAGCRIERVLQHVTDPQQVLSEVRRCLRPGGRVAVFEPEWSSLWFGASDEAVSAAVTESIVERHRQGTVGAQLGNLLPVAGFVDVTVQPETVAWTSLAGIRRSFRFDDDVARAETSVGSGARVSRWLAELAALESAGRLRVTFTRYYAAGNVPSPPRRPDAPASVPPGLA